MLCVDTDAEYIKQFEKFIMTDYECKIISSSPIEENLNEKFLLLVNIHYRIPEEVDTALKHFNLLGKVFLLTVVVFFLLCL